MQPFKEFLLERFINLFNIDRKEREKYADEVWELLQKSYAKIGGIKGSGFNSKQDMIDNIPFWKLTKKNGKIIVANFYKDKNGRKRVATATDGSDEAKKALANILVQEFSRSYFEVSKGMLKFLINLVGMDFIKKYAKTPKEAGKILKKDISLPDDNDSHMVKYPELKDFLYQRKIASKLETKILLGTTGKTIENFS